MSKALLYTANTTTQAVAIGDSVPLGSVVRRYGNCISVNGSTINLTEPGYYDIEMIATFNSAAAGNVKMVVQMNGAEVPGAEATETITTANTEYHAISIDTAVRVYCCNGGNISFVVDESSTAGPTINNFGVTVMRA